MDTDRPQVDQNYTAPSVTRLRMCTSIATAATRCRTVLIVTALAAGISACGAASFESREERAADQHAVAAANVMTQGFKPVSARDAAWRVVGTRGDTTIEALVADGTNRHGRIVLRISGANASEVDARATHCYEYVIDWPAGQTGAPPKRERDCSGPALVLHRPVAIEIISHVANARLLRVLAKIAPAQRRNAGLIRHRVAEVFRPPVTVGVGPTNSGDLEVTLRAGDECAFALVPASSKQRMLGTDDGSQCFGG